MNSDVLDDRGNQSRTNRPSNRQSELRAAVGKLNEVGLELTAVIDEIAGEGLSSNADVTVLSRLHDGPLRPRELLAVTGLTSAGMTNLVDRLEQRGLVVRIHGTLDDRRGVAIQTTPAGRDLIGSVFDAIGQRYDDLLPVRREIVRLLGAKSRRRRGPAVASAHAVMDRLAQVGVTIARAVQLDDFPDDPAPTRTMTVLTAAADDDGVRPRQLIRITTLSTGGVTQLLDRLEGQGFITRTTGRAPDRRAVVVRLTPMGEQALERRLERIDSLAPDLAAALA